MKLRFKFALYSLIYSVVLLVMLLSLFFYFSYQTRQQEIDDVSNDNITLLSQVIEHEFYHFTTVVGSIGLNDTLRNELETSNDYFDTFEPSVRDAELISLSEQWKSTDDENDPFIAEYLQNDVSDILNDIADNEEDLFGEIFVTNKYGVVVGTTSKLTTITHAHKYWWEGSYNDGDSQIYFDDRGYDESVGAVVLGVVISLYNDQDEFMGVLKVNFKVTGMLDEHVMHFNEIADDGEYIIARPDGVIISKHGVTPLTESLPTEFNEYLVDTTTKTGMIAIDGDEYYFGMTNITTNHIEVPAIFGGSAESIDHSLGSDAGEWRVIYYSNPYMLNEPTRDTMTSSIIFGILGSIILLVFSYLLGVRYTRPVVELQLLTKQMTKGNYDIEIDYNSKDEIGDLYKDFSHLIYNLKTSTTSINNLEREMKQRSILEKKLRDISQIDELTKIYNRRAFNEYLVKYCSIADRNNSLVGVVIFDIDDFKHVNDTYGHMKGDIVLKEIATTVKAILRSSDIFARWGGEEFMILIPDADKENVNKIAEKVRLLIEEIHYEYIDHVTVSLGCAIKEEGDTINTLITRVDKALYVSKISGKNISTFLVKKSN